MKLPGRKTTFENQRPKKEQKEKEKPLSENRVFPAIEDRQPMRPQ
jgi:hypothetical protein